MVYWNEILNKTHIHDRDRHNAVTYATSKDETPSHSHKDIKIHTEAMLKSNMCGNDTSCCDTAIKIFYKSRLLKKIHTLHDMSQIN